MTLPPSTFLGPYQILALIGSGGMGMVYRAKDPRLGREVAIKVLLPALAADADRLKRFEQEARAVALLNHPNILQVYDTGMFEGMPYLVMELLAGESLRERMGGKPLPLRKAVDIGIQIARGLAVAHDKGIIHRDLKPENIIVSPEGLVKILDFGLAKLLAPLSTDVESTQDHVALSQLTQVGAVVGTAGYMSPEQVNGLPLDGRSDLFSFGIILWEMLAGARPFQGVSVVETMHAILKDEPREFEPGLPLSPALDRALRRCLEKDPKARFQTAQDLIFSLESSSLGGPALPRLRSRGQRQSFRRWALGAACVLGLAGLTGGAWWVGHRTAGHGPVTYNRLTYRNGLVRSARFAPDGQTFVYALAQEGRPSELLLGRIDGVGARPLALPPGAQILSISAAGEMALLLRDGAGPGGTLAQAPLGGGIPKGLLEHVFDADWSPDGKDLAVVVQNDKGVPCLDFPLGHRLLAATGSTQLDCPRVSPRGDLVAFLEYKGIGKETLAVVDRQGHRRVLVNGMCGSLQWAPDGRRIFFTFRHDDDRQDLRSVTLAGRQKVVDTVMGRVRIRDLSRSGRLLLEHTLYRTTMVVKTPSDPAERELSWLQSSVAADLSPDGRRVLFGELREGMAPGGAYLRSTATGSEAMRLGDGDPLALSPDGKWALVNPLDGAREVVLLPTGPGTPRRFKGLRPDWGLFLPGGRQMLLGGTGPGGAFQYFNLDLRSGDLRPWTMEGSADAYCVLAPDGARVALGPVGGQVSIHTLDGRPLHTVGGLLPGEWLLQWRADGNALFVADPSRLPAKIHLLDLATGARTLWKELAPPDRAGVERLKTLCLTPDGQSYAYSFQRTLTSDLYVTDPLP